MKHHRGRLSHAWICWVIALCACVAGCGADDDDAAAGSGGAAADIAGSSGKAAGASGSGGVTAGSGGSGAAVGMSSGGRGGSLGSGGAGGSIANGAGGMTGAGAGGAGSGSGGAAAGSGGAGDRDAGPGPGGSSDILAPDNGALLGAFYGADSIEQTTQKLGHALAIHLTYFAWGDDWTQDSTKSDLDAGRIPLVNWEPYDTTLDKIIDGSQDTRLHQLGQSAKNLKKKFFFDFAAEMNGDWSPWSGSDNGMSADKYIAAYRHLHDIFSGEGATNMIWAWCPNVTDEPDVAWNQTLNYYPGDDYVDWTCVDGYNWGGGGGGGWQSFKDVFARHLRQARDQEQTDPDRRNGIGRRQQRQEGRLDRSDDPDAARRLPADQGRGVVRHQQGKRLAHQLIAGVGGGVQADGERSVLR